MFYFLIQILINANDGISTAMFLFVVICGPLYCAPDKPITFDCLGKIYSIPNKLIFVFVIVAVGFFSLSLSVSLFGCCSKHVARVQICFFSRLAEMQQCATGKQAASSDAQRIGTGKKKLIWCIVCGNGKPCTYNAFRSVLFTLKD